MEYKLMKLTLLVLGFNLLKDLYQLKACNQNNCLLISQSTSKVPIFIHNLGILIAQI